MMRLYALFAAFLLTVALLSSTASAQFCTANTTPNASDTAQLPLSVHVYYGASDNTWTVNDQWLNAIWPRSAPGAWYRPYPAYTPSSAIKTNVYPWAYTCRTTSNSTFECLDIARGIKRSVSCPAFIYPAQYTQWRSLYNGAWREQGCFNGQGPWGANFWPIRQIPVTSASVTGNGRQLNCSMGNDVRQGPGLLYDLWVYRR
jgi:hypothetical protein